MASQSGPHKLLRVNKNIGGLQRGNLRVCIYNSYNYNRTKKKKIF